MDLRLPALLLPLLVSVKDPLTRLKSLQLVIHGYHKYGASEETIDLSDFLGNVEQTHHVGQTETASTINPIMYRLFQDAPLLRTIRLDCSRPLFSFPWAQITRYESHKQALQHSFENARQCKTLRTFTISSTSVGDSDISALLLPHLHNLQIINKIDFDNPILAAAIPHITAPSLASLEIQHENSCEGTEWPHNIMLSFLARSQCHIKKLALQCVFISPYELVDLLGQLPMLETLIVEEVRDQHRLSAPFTNDVLEAMICSSPPSSGGTTQVPSPSSPNGSTLVPLLNRLHLQGDLCLSDHPFVDMIESRLPLAPTKLAKPVMFVEVVLPSHMMGHGEVDEGARDRMNALRPRGLLYIVRPRFGSLRPMSRPSFDFDFIDKYSDC